MRIALISSTFPPEGAMGGLAAFYFELAHALANAGHQVLVVTMSSQGGSQTEENNLKVLRLPFDPQRYAYLSQLKFVPTFAWSLPKAIELYRASQGALSEFKPDVIECVETGFEGLMWALRGEYPLVVRCLCPQFHLMTIDDERKTTDLDREVCSALETFVIQSADGLTAPSMNLARIVSEHTQVPVESIDVIKNPLRIDDRAIDSISDAFAPDAFPKVLYVGRVEKLKGCDLLVEMLPEVVAEFPKAQLVFAGQEYCLAGQEISVADGFRQRLKELAVEDHAKFLGMVPRTDLKSLVVSADLCVLPSRYDSSPYSCLEAMSYGAALIATTVGGIPEYIQHGKTGWLVKPSAAEELAQAVIFLSKDHARRKELAQAAKRDITEQCNPHTIASQSVGLYAKAIKSFAPGCDERASQVSKRLLSIVDAFCETPYFAHQIDSEVAANATETYRIAAEEAYRVAAEQTYRLAADKTWQEAYEAGYQAGQAAGPAGLKAGLKNAFKQAVGRVRKATDGALRK